MRTRKTLPAVLAITALMSVLLSGCSAIYNASHCSAAGACDGDSERDIRDGVDENGKSMGNPNTEHPVTAEEAQASPILKRIDSRMEANVSKGGTLFADLTDNDTGKPYTITAASDGTKFYTVTKRQDKQFLEAGNKNQYCSMERPADTVGLPEPSEWNCTYASSESDSYKTLAAYGYLSGSPLAFLSGGLSGNSPENIILGESVTRPDDATLSADFGTHHTDITYSKGGDKLSAWDENDVYYGIEYTPGFPVEGFPEIPAPVTN